MEMLKNAEGQTSSLRVVWAMSTMIVMFVWAYVSIVSMDIQHLTIGDAVAFGLLFGIKPMSTMAEHMKIGVTK